jgi:CBS domain-containing protein
MKTVKDILGNKASSILSIAPNETVLAAIKLMAEKNVGALPVMVGEKLVGILSERDYARKVILRGRSSEDTLVKDIMTENVLTVSLHNSNEECMELMTEKHLRHLPVVENGLVIGMISIGDVVKAIISAQSLAISNLQDIINNSQSDKNFRNLLFREMDRC